MDMLNWAKHETELALKAQALPQDAKGPFNATN